MGGGSGVDDIKNRTITIDSEKPVKKGKNQYQLPI
jgi:hypothetical protein